MIVKTVPAILGLGVLWIGRRLIANEARILLRQIELEEALVTKSAKSRKHLLLGSINNN